MILRPLLLAAVLLAGSVSSSVADHLRCSPVAVVELFTSQGCSSCPKADALLREIGAREDVIALAYHVDYWDYIGWPDTFARPAYSNYQRAYARALELARVYTPQLVVNGREQAVGSRRGEVEVLLAQASLPLDIEMTSDGGLLDIVVAGAADFSESVVWLVTFRDSAQVAIGRGENRDRVLEYSHIVTGRQVLGMWEPAGGARIRLPLSQVLGSASDGAAIIVQENRDGLPGPILGAASFML